MGSRCRAQRARLGGVGWGQGEGGPQAKGSIHSRLIHTAVWQKTTQQYKAITLSIKNKFKNESHPLSGQERVRSRGISFPSEVPVLAKRQVLAGGSLRASPQTLPSCRSRGSQAPRTQRLSGSSGHQGGGTRFAGCISCRWATAIRLQRQVGTRGRFRAASPA